MDYAGDRYGLQLERLVVGDHFNPEIGFVRRDDMRRSLALARFSPRPRGSTWCAATRGPGRSITFRTTRAPTSKRGTSTASSRSSSRLNPSSQLSIEPSYTVNWVDLEDGSFTTHLAGSRVTYTMTPLMFTSALVQYNSTSHSVSANVRLRWGYRPGSELFVVYNEDRNTEARGFPDFSSRAALSR